MANGDLAWTGKRAGMRKKYMMYITLQENNSHLMRLEAVFLNRYRITRGSGAVNQELRIVLSCPTLSVKCRLGHENRLQETSLGDHVGGAGS